MNMADRIRAHLDADDAFGQLRHYLAPQAFSGAAFETIGGRGDAPETANRFTPADLVAVTTLSVRVSGWGAIDLLETRKDEFAELLATVPHTPLHKASDKDLDTLWPLQDALNRVDEVGHVTRSKLLARKRPHLVPIRDQHVLRALTGENHGNFTRPLRDALQGAGIIERLTQLRDQAGADHLSLLRVLDIIVWMRTHGAASVST